VIIVDAMQPCLRVQPTSDRDVLIDGVPAPQTEKRDESLAFPQPNPEESDLILAREPSPYSPRETGRPRSGRQKGGVPREGVMRAVDVVLSGVMLIFLLPALVVIAVCIYLIDPGPVIFAHRRVGKDGKTFHCYKFRSMFVGAEERLEALLANDPTLRAQWTRDQKLDRDPRITRIGGVLRVTSLDELPQLVNVLRGEMSLVGPRPIVPNEVPRYGRFIASYYSVKPGLTGLWQVTGRSNTTYRRRVATDVYYARTKSLALDARILLATVPAVVVGRGSM
jgi:undecaprenyl-phosphate galactose phosphotransferase